MIQPDRVKGQGLIMPKLKPFRISLKLSWLPRPNEANAVWKQIFEKRIRLCQMPKTPKSPTSFHTKRTKRYAQ